MIDKRFCSGAIIVATVVVAGASALPTLLLRPSASEPAISPVVVAPPVDRKAEPVVARVGAPSAAKSEEPESVAALALPAIAPPSAAPAAAASVQEAAAASPVAFPPVQPVGVVASGPEPVPPVAASKNQSAGSAAPEPVAAEKPVRSERAIAPRETKFRRIATRVRPAPYPIREFLAWRR